MIQAKHAPPRNLDEVLKRNRELVESASDGARLIYRMNREYEARLAQLESGDVDQ